MTFLVMQMPAPRPAESPVPATKAESTGDPSFNKLIGTVRTSLTQYHSEALPPKTDTKIAVGDISEVKITLHPPVDFALTGKLDERDPKQARIECLLAGELTVHVKGKQAEAVVPARVKYRVEADYAFVSEEWRLGEIRLVPTEIVVTESPARKADIEKAVGQTIRLSAGTRMVLVRIFGAPAT